MILKPGEREAFVAWWSRAPMLQGALMGLGAGIVGIMLAGLLIAFISAFIDLN